MTVQRFALAVASFAFVMGLALSTLAAREVVTGTVEKVDSMKGVISVKTATGSREFNSRFPEKLKEVKVGDKIQLTIQEDGSLVIEPAK